MKTQTEVRADTDSANKRGCAVGLVQRLCRPDPFIVILAQHTQHHSPPLSDS